MTKQELREAVLGEKMRKLAEHDYKTNKKLRELKMPDQDMKALALRGGRPRHGETLQEARNRRGLD